MQATFSLANFWRDYHYQNYLDHNTFLPLINNELGKNNYTQAYKDNFLKVKHFYVFGSRDDEIIQPWFSSFFAQYADGDQDIIVAMRNTTLYQNDTFGLRTLYEEGRMTLKEVPKVSHCDWHNATIFTDYVLDYLY